MISQIVTPKSQATKEKHIKLTFVLQRILSQKGKGNPKNRRKYLQSHMNKGLVDRTYKELLQRYG